MDHHLLTYKFPYIPFCGLGKPLYCIESIGRGGAI
jgi:hypothetical protein